MAVAESSRAINDGNLILSRQAIVLQTIVRNNDVDAKHAQILCCVYPVRVYDDRAITASGHQDGFVSDDQWVTVSRHLHGTSANQSSVSPADDAGPHATLFKLPGQPDRYRRFAGATDGNVADDDDRPIDADRIQYTASIQSPP
jgi:hypothetical protein